jgi:molecular chaperone DnaJ
VNLKEAYQTLGLSESATPEEAKKKYRELAKKLHPDQCKEDGAEDKFKKINEAYECVKTGKGSDKEQISSPFDINFNDFNIHNPFSSSRSRKYYAENIELNTRISFAESVLGCKKQISFRRNSKCNVCNGQGKQRLDNGCSKCKGQGTVTTVKGNMVFTQTCDKCFGKSNIINCGSCNGEGFNKADVSIDVTIPGGVVDQNILRLSGMGNFVGVSMFGEQHTDAFLHISVTPEKGLRLEGQDVISELEISLLEALQGKCVEVKTILGNKEITVPPLSKNLEEVLIPNCGVNKRGNQRVILKVQYGSWEYDGSTLHFKCN